MLSDARAPLAALLLAMPVAMLMGRGPAMAVDAADIDRVYAFIFGQKGLMAGLGVQGSKITQINP